MSNICKSLNLDPIPHLGIYNTSGYKITISQQISDTIPEIPNKIKNQLKLLNLESTSIETIVVKHDGKWLQEFKGFIEVNLLFQPYVFYNSNFGETHESTIKLGVYTNEAHVENFLISNHCNDSVAINPKNVMDCDHFTCIHPQDGFMCLSPNNGRLKLGVFSPMIVFHSLILVPYKGKISRILITKHVLIISQELCLRFDQLENYFSLDFEISILHEIINNLGNYEEWLWYLYYTIWEIDGCQEKDSYGEIEWNRLISDFYEQNDKNTKEKIDLVFEGFLQGLQELKNIINENLVYV